ncbi:stress-activated map kinase interacting protein 1-domain-containing protein [Myxozyma melibiosi]|uniref:Stress-activated map kinase interacting protein 1-domain-containing protein n=1 Tax=Myxozyma melibiosi TaxID=54550 RepID=A0ABR1F1W7_9ASCO
MPARDKDRIPDVDQMLSTYITHQHKSAATTATIPDASPSSYSRLRYNYTYASDIGLAGNLDDKEGMTFLRSSSFRRGSSFDKRFNALWSDISMDDAIMEHEDLAASSSVVVGRPPSPSVVAGRPPSRSSSTSFSAAAAAAASSYSFSSPLPPLPPPEAFTPSPELFSLVDSPPRALTPLHPPVQLKSNLSALITASQAAEKNPFEIYTSASGVGELKPLRLKVYRPSSKLPKQPFDVVVKPYVTVADTIGYALYRYWEEKREPKLSDDEADVSKWTLHIVEDDGEPDLDFPALDRTRIISAFSFDEFALVEATPRQIAENRKLLGSA